LSSIALKGQKPSPRTRASVVKRYAEDGCRLTDCCGCYSTYHDDGDDQHVLCCKKCWEEVDCGQGDGSEYRTKQ